jgi:hypothetical protein
LLPVWSTALLIVPRLDKRKTQGNDGASGPGKRGAERH